MKYFNAKNLLKEKENLTMLVSAQAVMTGMTAALAFFEYAKIVSPYWKMLFCGYGAMFGILSILFMSLVKNLTFGPFSECERIAQNKRPRFLDSISISGKSIDILSSLEGLYKAAEERSGKLGEILIVISGCIVDRSRNRFMTATKYTECLYAIFGITLSIMLWNIVPSLLAIATMLLLNISNAKALCGFDSFIYAMGNGSPVKFN